MVGEEVDVRLTRSGWVEWVDSTLADEPILWPLVGVGYLVNLVVHWAIWRGGWVIKVYAPDRWRAVSKTRYPSKSAALADLDRQRALAPKFPLPEPSARLPTRGGTLRRPR